MKRLALLLFLVATSAQAQQSFGIALSGDDHSGCGILPFSSHGLEWLDPNSFQKPTDIGMIASGDGRLVYANQGGRILRIQPDGTRTPFFADPSFGEQAIAVGPDGRIFATIFTAGVYRLAVISPAGMLEATYPMVDASSSPLLAVAQDGCTIYYFTNNRIHRMNGCTGAAMSDFLNPVAAADIEPLSNGQVLVSINDRVDLFDAAGTFIRTVASLASYDLDGWEVGQVVASKDLSEVWLTKSGCDGEGILLRVSFATGAEHSRRYITLNTPNALIIGARAPSVPISNLALLILALGVATAAMLRI